MPKNAKTAAQLHSSHTLVMFKILQARLQQYVNRELPDIQAGFKKGRGTRDQIANIWWIIEKARELQKKTYTTVSLTVLKSLTVWITANWKILEEIEIPNHLTCLLREAWRAAIHGVTKSWTCMYYFVKVG